MLPEPRHKGIGLGPIPKNKTDFEDPPMEGLTLPGEQKGYGIGRVFVVGGAEEEGRERDLALTCKIIFFLIKIEK